MIDKPTVEQALQAALEGVDGAFVVSVKVSPADDIEVAIDTLAPGGLDIDTCAMVSRRMGQALEEAFPDADFSLEVGSAGLTTPFTVHNQYVKNIGSEVEVTTDDGRKLHAVLADATLLPDGSTDALLRMRRKVKEPGQKRPVETTVEETLNSSHIKRIAATINF